jgi:hypothetical protein
MCSRSGASGREEIVEAAHRGREAVQLGSKINEMKDPYNQAYRIIGS